MLIENNEGTIKNRQSRETVNVVYTKRKTKTNKTKPQQHNMCWTLLFANKQK